MSRPQWTEDVLEALDGAPPGVLLWDADFTLWATDIGFLAWRRSVDWGRLREAATEPISEELIAIGAMPRFEPHADGRQLMEYARHGGVSDEALISVMVTCFAGWTPAELEDLGAEIARHELGRECHEGIHELLAELARRGHRSIVITASSESLVRGAVRELALPVEDIIGIQARLDDEGRIGNRVAPPLSFHDGKVTAWRARAATLNPEDRPILGAFSDSASDRAMLELASRLRGAVHPSARLLRTVEEQGEPWRLLRPAATVGGRALSGDPEDLFEMLGGPLEC